MNIHNITPETLIRLTSMSNADHQEMVNVASELRKYCEQNMGKKHRFKYGSLPESETGTITLQGFGFVMAEGLINPVLVVHLSGRCQNISTTTRQGIEDYIKNSQAFFVDWEINKSCPNEALFATYPGWVELASDIARFPNPCRFGCGGNAYEGAYAFECENGCRWVR